MTQIKGFLCIDFYSEVIKPVVDLCIIFTLQKKFKV